MNVHRHRQATSELAIAGAIEARLHVTLIGPQRATVAICGPLTIGRAPEADLHVDDPLVSRRHAVVHAGEHPAFEDLGSANGSWRRRGAAVEDLAPDCRIALANGDVIALGSRWLVVHHGGPAFTRMLVDHGAFEAKLALACARDREPVAVLRVQMLPGTDPDLAQATLLSLASVVDGVVCSALDELTLLLLVRHDAVIQARRLAAQLAALAMRGDVGVAIHPRDGATAQALLAVASEAGTPLRARLPTAPIATAPPPRASGRLLVGARGRHVELPSGERIELRRHAALRLIVLALARRRRDGGGLSSDELLACGWPGERVDPFAGNARVRVALSRLRSLGLRDLLVRGDDEYVLAPELAVEIEGEPTPQ